MLKTVTNFDAVFKIQVIQEEGFYFMFFITTKLHVLSFWNNKCDNLIYSKKQKLQRYCEITNSSERQNANIIELSSQSRGEIFENNQRVDYH